MLKVLLAILISATFFALIFGIAVLLTMFPFVGAWIGFAGLFVVFTGLAWMVVDELW